MVAYPTCTRHKTYEIKGDWYALVSPYGDPSVSMPQFRSKSTAKAYITKELRWQESIRGARPWTLDQVKNISSLNSIYKLIDGEWLLIFEKESPAFFAWCEGKLTREELRDSIEW